VITDEQANDTVRSPRRETGERCYLINVASSRNGVGYRQWTHVNGFSEAVVEYIAELELPAGEA
jgi:60 kDa SS-A/Ro ribonucleoprotein